MLKSTCYMIIHVTEEPNLQSTKTAVQALTSVIRYLEKTFYRQTGICHRKNNCQIPFAYSSKIHGMIEGKSPVNLERSTPFKKDTSESPGKCT